MTRGIPDEFIWTRMLIGAKQNSKGPPERRTPWRRWTNLVGPKPPKRTSLAESMLGGGGGGEGGGGGGGGLLRWQVNPGLRKPLWARAGGPLCLAAVSELSTRSEPYFTISSPTSLGSCWSVKGQEIAEA